MSNPLKLVIHGGVANKVLSSKLAAEYHKSLRKALKEGYQKLVTGESSLDAVQQAVAVLENSSHFNAGRGSVLTRIKTVELDAAMMDGKSLEAGSVAGISKLPNPIALARIILEHSEHIMLIGEHAENFAKKWGLALISPESLITKKQIQKLLSTQKKSSSMPDKLGTVGAVALDYNGNLAAATSTGGLVNKHPGRVGDSCIIGAGTYADNSTCAISTTGQGEYFMRLLTAYDIAALIQYKEYSLRKAVNYCLKKLTLLGGKGGIIALNCKGNIAISFNTKGMFRGYIDRNKMVTEIY